MISVAAPKAKDGSAVAAPKASESSAGVDPKASAGPAIPIQVIAPLSTVANPPASPQPSAPSSTQCCVACHGSGSVSADLNMLLFNFLANNMPRISDLRNPQVRPLEDHESFSLCRETTSGRPLFIVLEVAFGRGSVICRACQECYHVGYIGIHACLEESQVRFEVLRTIREALAESSSGSKLNRKRCILTHISLPYKGGSPLLNFSGRNASHEKEFFHLLKATEKYLDEINSLETTTNTISFELPKFNQYWKSRELESFLQKYEMTHQSYSAIALPSSPIGRLLAFTAVLVFGSTFTVALGLLRLSQRFAFASNPDGQMLLRSRSLRLLFF